MDDDDRPRQSGASRIFGAASQLSGESLDSYSLDELNARITLLEAEIARIRAHREKSAAHIAAAASLFKSSTS